MAAIRVIVLGICTLLVCGPAMDGDGDGKLNGRIVAVM